MRRLGDYTPLPYPPRGGCSGTGSGTARKVVSTAGAGALAVAPFTGPAAPFVAIGGAIVSLFSSLFGGHAQKVANESAILCSAVPASNAVLQQIYSGVKSGTMSPAHGSTALDQLVSQFATAVKPIAKGTFGTSKCNGACLYKGWLNQAVQQMKSEFQGMQAAAAGASGSSATIAGSQIPGWAIAAGIFAGGLILTELI